MTTPLSKEIETILDELDRNSFSYSFGSTEQRTWLRQQLISLASLAEERGREQEAIAHTKEDMNAYKEGKREMLKKAIACIEKIPTHPSGYANERRINPSQILTALTNLSLTNE